MSLLNAKIARTLLDMPGLGETAFVVVHPAHVDAAMFALRYGSPPVPGEEQVYSFLPEHLDYIVGHGLPRKILATFDYVLNVPPLSSRRLWVAVKASTAGVDPLVQLHAPELATATGTAFHFLDERARDAFVAAVMRGGY